MATEASLTDEKSEDDEECLSQKARGYLAAATSTRKTCRASPPEGMTETSIRDGMRPQPSTANVESSPITSITDSPTNSPTLSVISLPTTATEDTENASRESEAKCKRTRTCNGSYITGKHHTIAVKGQRACGDCKSRSGLFVSKSRSRLWHSGTTRKGVKTFSSTSSRIRAYLMQHTEKGNEKCSVVVFMTEADAEVASREHGYLQEGIDLVVQYSCHVHRFEIQRMSVLNKSVDTFMLCILYPHVSFSLKRKTEKFLDE